MTGRTYKGLPREVAAQYRPSCGRSVLRHNIDPEKIAAHDPDGDPRQDSVEKPKRY